MERKPIPRSNKVIKSTTNSHVQEMMAQTEPQNVFYTAAQIMDENNIENSLAPVFVAKTWADAFGRITRCRWVRPLYFYRMESENEAVSKMFNQETVQHVSSPPFHQVMAIAKIEKRPKMTSFFFYRGSQEPPGSSRIICCGRDCGGMEETIIVSASKSGVN
jgi:hypothetical protein